MALSEKVLCIGKQPSHLLRSVRSSPLCVVGVVAAYRRPAMLRNLLASLPGNESLRQVIVVDNGRDPEIELVSRQAPVPVLYYRPDRNLGCGGGVGRGLRLGVEQPEVTHVCTFDDDAEAGPGALDALVGGMASVSADVGVPLVLNCEGDITWIPGLCDARAWEVIRQPRLKPEDYYKRCGREPIPFSWAPWPMMAFTVRVVQECGYPREDFWLCAEDLEYSLRLTHHHTGVLVPNAMARHLPPMSVDWNRVGGPHYLRFCLMLQNLSYACTRLPYARRALRHLPGNYRRFLRTFGLNGSTLRDAGLAFWRGAFRGKPAGVPGADGFKNRFLALGSGPAW